MSESASHRLQAGKVGRPHGLDGSFYVNAAVPRLLGQGISVEIEGRCAKIVRHAGTPAHPILRLEGVDDRAAADALRGTTLSVAIAQAPALPEGEWWAHELEGCAVQDGERHIGTVVALVVLPSCEALDVRGRQGEELLIPMVRDAVIAVDVERRQIEVNMEFVGGAS